MNILDKERKLKSLLTQLETMEDDILIVSIKQKIEDYKHTAMTNLTAWDRVLLARHQNRPTAKDYINYMCDSFIELHGDRLYRDDGSIIGGIGEIDGIVVTIIAEQKGKTVDENITRNFAMPHPEGYRKALRLMQQAEKFNRPIVTLIDTPGAYPGIGAEERGQGEAIAKNLYEMSHLKVPIIALVIGEGGSGGALALGVADQILMLENAIYSILSPEGYASILWKDASKASAAAESMKLTSYDLEELSIIDGIIKEPIGGAHYNPTQTFEKTKQTIIKELLALKSIKQSDLLQKRYQKYRKIGFFQRFNYDNLGGIKR
ncbi:MAG: acetyl-CoA carboxylase carboxyltransferase subunit alpha [Candidatus Izimaplasma sp.]|nr:acetyl-CoA carboxylase carboxyltransferase subunit alpha [Candidatus Izimaplasma bacterium]